MKNTPTLTVVLSAGIVQVLSLDDSCMRDELGITFKYSGARQIRVTGTREALTRLRASANAGQHFCGERWYAASARAALRQLDAVLG